MAPQIEARRIERLDITGASETVALQTLSVTTTLTRHRSQNLGHLMVQFPQAFVIRFRRAAACGATDPKVSKEMSRDTLSSVYPINVIYMKTV